MVWFVVVMAGELVSSTARASVVTPERLHPAASMTAIIKFKLNASFINQIVPASRVCRRW